METQRRRTTSAKARRWRRIKSRAAQQADYALKPGSQLQTDPIKTDQAGTGAYTDLSFMELLLLDELISGDFGRHWDGGVEIITDAAATAYTPAELSRLIGIPESDLDTYLAVNWVEHSIRDIFNHKITVRFAGEGVLLSPSLNDCGRSLCRLFTPTPIWKARDCAA